MQQRTILQVVVDLLEYFLVLTKIWKHGIFPWTCAFTLHLYTQQDLKCAAWEEFGFVLRLDWGKTIMVTRTNHVWWNVINLYFYNLFQLLSLREANIPNIVILPSLEPLKKLVVVEWWGVLRWWVVEDHLIVQCSIQS